MSSQETKDHRTVRTRAKQACLHCNRRRIRCNVVQMRPCQNCLSLNVPCEVGVSKRGKYPRKKTARQHATSQTDGNSVQLPASSGKGETHSFTLPVVDKPKAGDSHDHLIPGTASTHQTVFFGESSPLTVVIDEGRRSPEKGTNEMHMTRFHYPIPERLDAFSTRDEAFRAHKIKQEAQLKADGAFSYPPSETCDTLLQAYFDWFHPCFPILDRAAVHESYTQGSLSPLLLQAMLFIGVSLCTDEAFARTEFSVRYWAKFLFYSRAKAIYDAEWESNKTVKIQSLFLLSFWRGGPSEERDIRFWLGIAIDLAQKRGMHLMSKFSFNSRREERLWKRLWWSLYARDQQSAAALGLPPHIRDEDCDVAMLEPDDIREEIVGGQSPFGVQCMEDLSYPAEMAKLAKLLRSIVSTQYSPVGPSPNDTSRAALHQQLVDWESSMPSELKPENAKTPRAKFLAGLLHMTYHNLYILLYRPSFLHPPDGALDSQGQIALDAATKSTRVLEDMLSHNLVQHGPPHLITHAFSTLCLHTIHFRRTSGTGRKLAEHRARLCLLSLQELQKSWDLENWVLNLFFRCLDDRTARTLRPVDASAPSPKTETRDLVPAIPDSFPALNIISEAGGQTLDTPLEEKYPTGDISAPSDWYSLFNSAEDYPDISGVAPSHDASLNLQNLESLYRFL
ncbi:hypothetical protein ASPBRDRAFT_139155 [Aspergillus brasiliensis CBS 101740]|uniref:Zn(2)-C6 fungal-type domain-containing protein n=1 Tax=Aspergillus brasiliensis (strain CBS 101740 / IMI 381727 / IBT 21946) TaxID=767769 RepID=A0A1L9U2P1_ASPBC|nr:hypothetical protein ASPBRDRAFT_139155 [Aspergillus brasiliensis CBS 101740]